MSEEKNEIIEISQSDYSNFLKPSELKTFGLGTSISKPYISL